MHVFRRESQHRGQSAATHLSFMKLKKIATTRMPACDCCFVAVFKSRAKHSAPARLLILMPSHYAQPDQRPSSRILLITPCLLTDMLRSCQSSKASPSRPQLIISIYSYSHTHAKCECRRMQPCGSKIKARPWRKTQHSFVMLLL